MVPAGRPAPAVLVHNGPEAAAAAQPAAAAAPAGADAAAATTVTSSKHRVKSERRNRPVRRRQEAPPPHRPTAQDRRRALLAKRNPGAITVPPPALQKVQPVRIAPVPHIPMYQTREAKEIKRDWKEYTAKAHAPEGSPRVPTDVPPPARLLHGSRAAAAAGVDPEEPIVMELTGQVLSERLPDANRDQKSSGADGASASSDSSKDATEQAVGMNAEADNAGAAEGVGDGSADVVGD